METEKIIYYVLQLVPVLVLGVWGYAKLTFRVETIENKTVDLKVDNGELKKLIEEQKAGFEIRLIKQEGTNAEIKDMMQEFRLILQKINSTVEFLEKYKNITHQN